MEATFFKFLDEYEVVLKNFRNNAFSVLEEVTESIIRCFHQGGKLILVGNGGSAADCQHIAGEMVGRYRRNRIPLPAISLTVDPSVITCIGNDYDYESIFSRQLEAAGKENDILWAFSTSGISPNILKAAQTARSMNIKVIAFTGIAESSLERLSDICLCAATKSTNHSQEIHQLAYHLICEYVDYEFAGK